MNECAHEPELGGELKTSGIPKTRCRHCDRLYLCDLDGNPVTFDEVADLFWPKDVPA